jgi:AraC family transcriptional regulator
MNEIAVVEVPPQIVLSLRTRGRYRNIADMVPQVFEYAFTHGIDIAGPPVFVCHETTPEEAMRADEEGAADIEVAVPILKRAEAEGPVTCTELSGGTMAVIVHRGPYEEAGPAYERLMAWIAAHHRRIRGPVREVYLNDPHAVPPADILTEICVPIE